MGFIQPPPKLNFFNLRERLFALMREKEYAFNSINTYRKICNLLESFLIEHNIEDYDPSVGQEFLATCEKYRGKIIDGKRVMTDMTLAFIKTLDNIVLFGKLKSDSTEKHFYCPDCFLPILKDYLDHLRNSNYHSSTIDNHYRYVAEFLTSVSNTSTSLESIPLADLYSIYENYASKSFSLYCISSFLQFAYKAKLTPTDFSKLIRFPKQEQKLPTVYSKNEIIQTLKCIDRSSVKGKRDYTMILIAYRLGLRVSDIVSLTLENIDFDNNKINIIQMKTGVPLSLPFLPEVKAAIEDYLSVRPCSISPEIFLRVRAPFVSLKRTAENSALKKYFNMASVNTVNKKCGLHTLRSTLASELVSENISYAVTQKILGHTDSSAIQHYVRLDIEALRECSLPVPPPTGNFKELLNRLEVNIND